MSAVASVAFGATYSVAVIPTPSGFTSVSMIGINSSGQVAGTGNNGTSYRALIVSPSGSAVIALPSGSSSAAGTAVNNAGQVTGLVDNGAQAFIGTAAGSTLIPLPAGWTSANGYAVNDSGQVAGWGIGPAGQQAFIGTVSGSAAIPLLAGATASASAVNAFGQVTGYSSGIVGQAYIGTTSGSTAIPLLPGGTDAVGVAINDSGQIAGLGNNGFTSLAFFATTAGSTAIPLPIGAAFAYMERQSINNSGTVVGTSNGSLPDSAGWIWDATNGTRLLNNLVPSGWKVSIALSISNNGLILAVASYNGGALQYVELVPAGLPTSPAPSTLALLLVGATCCWIWLRWRASKYASA